MASPEEARRYAEQARQRADAAAKEVQAKLGLGPAPGIPSNFAIPQSDNYGFEGTVFQPEERSPVVEGAAAGASKVAGRSIQGVSDIFEPLVGAGSLAMDYGSIDRNGPVKSAAKMLGYEAPPAPPSGGLTDAQNEQAWESVKAPARFIQEGLTGQQRPKGFVEGTIVPGVQDAVGILQDPDATPDEKKTAYKVLGLSAGVVMANPGKSPAILKALNPVGELAAPVARGIEAAIPRVAGAVSELPAASARFANAGGDLLVEGLFPSQVVRSGGDLPAQFAGARRGARGVHLTKDQQASLETARDAILRGEKPQPTGNKMLDRLAWDQAAKMAADEPLNASPSNVAARGSVERSQAATGGRDSVLNELAESEMPANPMQQPMRESPPPAMGRNMARAVEGAEESDDAYMASLLAQAPKPKRPVARKPLPSAQEAIADLVYGPKNQAAGEGAAKSRPLPSEGTDAGPLSPARETAPEVPARDVNAHPPEATADAGRQGPPSAAIPPAPHGSPPAPADIGPPAAAGGKTPPSVPITRWERDPLKPAEDYTPASRTDVKADILRDIVPVEKEKGVKATTSRRFVEHLKKMEEEAEAETAREAFSVSHAEKAVTKNPKAMAELNGEHYIQSPGTGLLFTKTQGIDAAHQPGNEIGRRFFEQTGIDFRDFAINEPEAKKLVEIYKDRLIRARGKRFEEMGGIKENGEAFTHDEGGNVLLRQATPQLKYYLEPSHPAYRALQEGMERTTGKEGWIKTREALEKMVNSHDRPMAMEVERTAPWIPAAVKDERTGKIYKLWETSIVPKVGSANQNQGSSRILNAMRNIDTRTAFVDHFGNKLPPELQAAMRDEGVTEKSIQNVVNAVHGLPSGGNYVRDSIPGVEFLQNSPTIAGQSIRAASAIHAERLLSGSGTKSLTQTFSEVLPNVGIKNFAKAWIKVLADNASGDRAFGTIERARRAGAVIDHAILSGKEAIDRSQMIESVAKAGVNKLYVTKRWNEAVATLNDEVAAEGFRLFAREALEDAKAGKMTDWDREVLSRMNFSQDTINNAHRLDPSDIEHAIDSISRRGAAYTQFRALSRLNRGKYQNSDAAKMFIPFASYQWGTGQRTSENFWELARAVQDGKWDRAMREGHRMVARVAGAQIAGATAAYITNAAVGRDRSKEGFGEWVLKNFAYASFFGHWAMAADAAKGIGDQLRGKKGAEIHPPIGAPLAEFAQDVLSGKASPFSTVGPAERKIFGKRLGQEPEARGGSQAPDDGFGTIERRKGRRFQDAFSGDERNSASARFRDAFQ